MQYNISNKWKLAAAGLIALYGGVVMAGQVGPMNTFTAGSPAVAADVNANFSEHTTQINDNDARITAIENQGDPNADGTFDISDIAGTYGGAMFKMGNLVKGGTYADDGSGNITNPDNYFLDKFGTAALKVTFDTAGNATVHKLRERAFESKHYTGVDAADGTTPAFDTSRSKVDNYCDLSAVSAFQANGGTLEQCDGDSGATDSSGTTYDFTLSFQVIDPAMRSIGAEIIDNTTGMKFKLRGYVSKDGNVITLRVFDKWCGNGYDTTNNKCTGGTFVGYGLLTLTRVN